MKHLAVFVTALHALTGCMATAPQAPVNPPPSASVVESQGVLLRKEISGSWISITTGLSSDFHLKDVKVLGGSFVAEFYFGSARALSCSLKEKVTGAYDGAKLEFELIDVGCQKPFYNRVVFDVKDGKGAYFGRRGQQFGWFVPTKIE
ncbi:MAG: hypothetical protein AB7P37_20955 [Ramlibacter sp.]